MVFHGLYVLIGAVLMSTLAAITLTGLKVPVVSIAAVFIGAATGVWVRSLTWDFQQPPQEHVNKYPAYLDEWDVFGTGELAAPSVIGD